MSEHSEHAAPHEHVSSVWSYLGVFAALMILTFFTVEAASFDLGEPELLGVRWPVNVMVALLIAFAKAILVILFFMHVKYADRLTWLTVASGFVFLAILLFITFSDYISRGWLGNPGT